MFAHALPYLLSLALLAYVGAASAQVSIEFVSHARDARVSYEPGAEALAESLVAVLPATIARVETAQYRPFAKPVRVLVTASESSYHALSGARGESRAATFFERVFISPRLAREPAAITGLLTHELSHLHLAQLTGEAAGRRIPTWFHEGLAVLVADGGGAEKVSAEQAVAAIRAGRYFTPDAGGDPRQVRSAGQFGLEPQLYYRQCALFVAFLRDRNAAGFRALLAALQARRPFDEAALETLGASIDILWEHFFSATNEN